MDDLLKKKPNEFLLVSQYTTNKLNTTADMGTMRQLVTMKIAEANKRLGRRAYREVLKALNDCRLGFELTDAEVEAWSSSS